MSFLKRSLAALLFASAMPAGVMAANLSEQTDAVNWLLRVSEAARHANYEGVVVYRDDQRMETMRIVHRHMDGREQERLTSLNGPSRDVFREDDHVTCILTDEHKHSPTTASLTPKRIFPEMSRETLAKVAEMYEFQDLGTARVAGHECHGVAIMPRDGFRYGYRVWADAKTSVPLKVSLIGSRGRVIEEMMFTRVAFPEVISDEALAIPAHHQKRKLQPVEPTAEVATEDASNELAPEPPRWQPVGLPPGFRVTMRSVKPSADGKSVVEHVLLSDGLSAVSVFSSQMKVPGPVFRGLSRMGGVNVYGRMLGRMHFTVVGEVPSSTVRLIGDAIESQE